MPPGKVIAGVSRRDSKNSLFEGKLIEQPNQRDPLMSINEMYGTTQSSEGTRTLGSKVAMTPPSSLSRKRSGNNGSIGKDITRKPSSSSLNTNFPPMDIHRTASPDLPIVHFRNRNIPGSGTFVANGVPSTEGEGTSNVTTLTQAQFLGTGRRTPRDADDEGLANGGDTLPGSPNCHSHTPSTERSSVASVVSVKQQIHEPQYLGHNAYSEPQLNNAWVTSPLLRDMYGEHPNGSNVGLMVLPAIDESSEGKSKVYQTHHNPSFDEERAKNLSVEELNDIKNMMRLFESDSESSFHHRINKSRSGPELHQNGMNNGRPLTIQNKGYRPAVPIQPFSLLPKDNQQNSPQRSPTYRHQFDPASSPFHPPAQVSSANVKSAPKITLAKMDYGGHHKRPKHTRSPKHHMVRNIVDSDDDEDNMSPPPLPPPPSDEALFGRAIYAPYHRPPVDNSRHCNSDNASRSAFRPVLNKLTLQDSNENERPLLVFQPASPTSPPLMNGLSNGVGPVNEYMNFEDDPSLNGQDGTPKNLPGKMLPTPAKADTFRPINQKLLAPPYQIKRRQPFRVPSRLCRSLDHIPSDIDDSMSSSSRTESPTGRQQHATYLPLASLAKHSFLPDNISLSSMCGSEVSHSDSNLNYDSGSTAYESEYDNYRPGMASDEDYFVPEPISDVDIDMFDDIDNVQVRENYNMDLSLMQKMITDV